MAAFSALSFSTSSFSVDAFDFGTTPVVPDERRGGGLRQVILKQEEKRDNIALAIFMLDG